MFGPVVPVYPWCPPYCPVSVTMVTYLYVCPCRTSLSLVSTLLSSLSFSSIFRDLGTYRVPKLMLSITYLYVWPCRTSLSLVSTLLSSLSFSSIFCDLGTYRVRKLMFRSFSCLSRMSRFLWSRFRSVASSRVRPEYYNVYNSNISCIHWIHISCAELMFRSFSCLSRMSRFLWSRFRSVASSRVRPEYYNVYNGNISHIHWIHVSRAEADVRSFSCPGSCEVDLGLSLLPGSGLSSQIHYNVDINIQHIYVYTIRNNFHSYGMYETSCVFISHARAGDMEHSNFINSIWHENSSQILFYMC